ncbi:hypothetical protein HQ403_03355 [Candidatus Kaiserbacteria bacterium]|nr:hypothetical protein [Candidatus Kaiserbacteria bacterium]
MRKFLLVLLKRTSYVAMFLVTALASNTFLSDQGVKNDGGYILSKEVSRAHADVPYSQSSYYSQGVYGDGGDDGGADGGGDGGGCDGGDDGGDCDDA